MKISIEVTNEGKIKLERSDDCDPITGARLLAEGAARMLAPFKAEVQEEKKIIIPKMVGV